MRCPFCGYQESRVIDSRPAEEGATIRRRRECLSCQKRFTTYEIMERMPLVVVKKDGSRQTFDKNKLIRSMLKACEKRSVALDELEQIANKAKLIGYTRNMRRTIRRNGFDTEEGKAVIEHCKSRIIEILETTDSLLF